jgi:thioredoxin-related protein
MRCIGIRTMSRRGLGALLLTMAPGGQSGAAPVHGNQGYTQDWFSESLLDLREDLRRASAGGKRLAVVFQQRNCPYCREMHTVHLVDPAIEGFIRPRFRLLQFDLHGTRRVTDLDGQALEERQLARRWRVTFTPTIVFLPETLPEPPHPGREVEVARMPGLLAKPEFLGLFSYVVENAYAGRGGFRGWWEQRGAACEAQLQPAPGVSPGAPAPASDPASMPQSPESCPAEPGRP